MAVGINVDCRVVQEELHKFLLIHELRLLAEKPEERRLVFLVGHVRVAAIKQHDLDALGHVRIILVRQKINENVK